MSENTISDQGATNGPEKTSTTEASVHNPNIALSATNTPPRPQAAAPAPERRKRPEPKKEESNSDTSKVILIVLVLLLIGAVGYLLFNRHSKVQVIEQQETRIKTDSLSLASTVSDLETLKGEADELREKFKALGLTNDSLEAYIVEIELELASARTQRNADFRTINQKNNIIAGLRRELKSATDRLAILEAERDSLSGANKLLQEENFTLNYNLNNLTAVKTELEQKVAIASVLKVDSKQISAINAKGKEITKEPFKAKVIDNLKIVFKLADNQVAKKENKKFLMRVIEPDGSVLVDEGTGGGTFKMHNKDMFYTLSQDKMFDNSKQNISFLYKKGSAYKKGKHTVELYADGERIGEAKFDVK